MEEKTEKLTRAQAFKLDLYFWLQALVVALVGLILTFSFVGRVIAVDGSSMVPTLHHGDILLLQSIAYTPRQGDVVVLNKPFGEVNKPIVKRIIATGGQSVDIDYISRTVSVDGVVLEEGYINLDDPMDFPASQWETITHITVPEGSVFVMGDNRNHSSDSRDERLGCVDERLVLGRAVWIVLPFANFGGIRSGS